MADIDILHTKHAADADKSQQNKIIMNTKKDIAYNF